MRVEQSAAVTGDVLDDADDAPRLQPAEDHTAERRDAHRLAAERAIARDVARARLRGVPQRQAGDGPPDNGAHRGERPRGEARSLNSALSRTGDRRWSVKGKGEAVAVKVGGATVI